MNYSNGVREIINNTYVCRHTHTHTRVGCVPIRMHVHAQTIGCAYICGPARPWPAMYLHRHFAIQYHTYASTPTAARIFPADVVSTGTITTAVSVCTKDLLLTMSKK